MAGLTLDTGALIAYDRGDTRTAAYLAVARSRSAQIVVPAPVVAQAWRGSRNARMKQLLDRCVIQPFTPELAFQIGELLAKSRTADVVDALLVVTAARRGDDILTGDEVDIRHLAGFIDSEVRVLPLGDLPRP